MHPLHLLATLGVSTAFLAPTPLSSTSSRLFASSASTWKDDDDWNRLSRTENAQSMPESGEDIVGTAARSFDEDAKLLYGNEGETLTGDDLLVSDMVETIHAAILPSDDDDDSGESQNLYDYPGEISTVTMEDEMGREISMLIRCNERPEELLIDQGRALPPLTQEEADEVSQIVVNGDEPTDFFRNAIAVMFQEHSTRSDKKQHVMDRAAVASWMTKSLGSHVSAHDKRVVSTVSRFSEYGTGYLTEENFDAVYTAALKAALDGSRVQIGRKTMGKIEGQPTIETIWRDIRNHNMISPVEAEREMKMAAIRQKQGQAQQSVMDSAPLALEEVMDECEILDDGQLYATTTSSTPWDNVKSNEKSSHELVSKAADGTTPLYLRDGDFIFIDEESCIGCTQCALSAPSSFLMLDNGRARTFLQRNDPDVAAAVSTCPVSCMHRVSFPELQELETTREKGDGRTDHRHCGKTPTPLHIARRGTDANHKSSWYHYLKQKCYLSKDCPTRGCYACPNFSAPGENPHWKLKHQKAEAVRAATFVQRGAADKYRKVAEL